MQIYDGREDFYQWDVNQKITSSNFKVGDKIHFTSLEQSTALVVLAYELDGKIVANVPNILFQNSYPIKVYRYITVTDMGYTIDEHQFKVIKRPRPDDYVYTETEVLTYKALDDRIAKLEEQGGQSVDLSNYYTKGETDEAISTAIEGIEIPETDLSGYVAKADVLSRITEDNYMESGKPVNTQAVHDYIQKELSDYVDTSELERKFADGEISANEILYDISPNSKVSVKEKLDVITEDTTKQIGTLAKNVGEHLNSLDTKIEEHSAISVVVPEETADQFGTQLGDLMIWAVGKVTSNDIAHIPNDGMPISIKQKLDDIDAEIGNVDSALDNIIAIQNSLIGGDGE